MITEIEDYFTKGCGRCARFGTPGCSTRRWAEGLGALRRICREAGLGETVKWGHPCYMHAGRNVAILAAFRGDFRLGFFRAALMTDPAQILERQGPNTPHPDTIRFRDSAQVAAMEPLIRAYLLEARGHAEAGTVPPKAPRDAALPDDLAGALAADPDLAEAFFRLTPGRQNSYRINLASAKTPATRTARIERFRARILAGKGATER